MALEWWTEIGALPPDPWQIGYSDPACRRLSHLSHLKDPPDIQPLKDLLLRLRREGCLPRLGGSEPLFRSSVSRRVTSAFRSK
jgi:hypothetical protein